jgi:hypothetical protein
MLSKITMISRSQLSLGLNAAVLLALAGCAAPRQSRFQMPFVAPGPVVARDVVLSGEPPALPPNLYLSKETPTFIPGQSRLAPLPTPSDLLISRADDAFQKGKRFYQSGDKERARKQFDRAKLRKIPPTDKRSSGSLKRRWTASSAMTWLAWDPH